MTRPLDESGKGASKSDFFYARIALLKGTRNEIIASYLVGSSSQSYPRGEQQEL